MTTLAQDSFDRSDSSTTLGTSTSGHTWTAVTGTWGISSNEAYSVSDTDGDMAVLPALSVNDYIVSCSMKGDPWGVNYRKAYIVFKYIDATNFWVASTTDNALQLDKVDAGTKTTVGLYGFGANVPDDTYFSVKAACVGNQINVYVDGTLRITYTMTTGENTKYGTAKIVGIRMLKAASPTFNARWNDFLVEDTSTGTAGSGSLQGVGTVTANGVIKVPGTGSLQGVGTVTANGAVITVVSGSGSLQGVGTVTANGVNIVPGTGSLQGVGTVTANGSTGIAQTSGSGSLQGVGTITANGTIITVVNGSGALQGVGSIVGNGVLGVAGTGSLQGVGAVTANGTNSLFTNGSGSLQGVGSIIANGLLTVAGSASAQGVGTTTANGVLKVVATAILQAVGRATANGSLAGAGVVLKTVMIIGRRNLTATLRGVQYLTAMLTGKRYLTATLKGGFPVYAQNQDFTMSAGDSFTIVVNAKNQDDSAMNLNGATIKWALKRSVTSTAIINKTTSSGIAITDSTNGIFKITLAPTDTTALHGYYYHEAEVTDQSGNISTVFTGTATILPSGV